MPLFQELDEWAYQIENEFKEKCFASARVRRQYMNICTIRDRLYNMYIDRIAEKNKMGGCMTVPNCKSCYERMKLTMPKPPNKQPQWVAELTTGNVPEMRQIGKSKKLV